MANFKTRAQQEAFIRKVIENISSALCDQALVISALYKSDDVFECVKSMTPQEWSAITNQPANIQPIWIKLANNQNQTWRDLVQFAFSQHQTKQAKIVMEAAE